MRTFIVDAFTGVPFRGNPAGVCFVESDASPALMLQVAQELGLSETAFLRATPRADTFGIRYFSPKVEIPLCGHATLAAAKAVFEVEGVAAVTFVTESGLELVARASEDGIEMELPAYTTQPATAPAQLLAALGLSSVRNVEFNAETRILLLEIGDTAVLAALAPDFAALYASHDSIHGVLVTAPSSEDGFDFHSRYFWPWTGTNEDPVTGGTHTFLAGYWGTRLGKTRMRSFQSSARTGSMDVELLDGTVLIRAHATLVLEGRLQLPVHEPKALTP